jgi:acyl carrier protein
MTTPDQTDVNRIVEIVLGRRGVRPEDDLMRELGAESMDIVNIARLIEEQFGVFIPEERLADLRSPADILAVIHEEAHGSDIA